MPAKVPSDGQRSRNRMLGGRRPLDLMDEGESDSAVVREAARAFVDGAYV
jgi:hypothetical protein